MEITLENVEFADVSDMERWISAQYPDKMSWTYRHVDKVLFVEVPDVD